MLQPPLESAWGHCWCGGVVEVGQDVPGSAFERPAQRHELGQAPRYARGGQCVDFGLYQGLTADFVEIAVGAW